MRSKPVSAIVLALAVTLFCPATGFGQVHNVTLPPGKKVVLKGQVRAGSGHEQLYVFEAQPKQHLTVHLIADSGTAVFSVKEQYRVDREAIVEEKTDWAGSLPKSESNGLYSIAVMSPEGTAVYTLDITLDGAPSANRPAGSQSGHPKTVQDYYLLMPEKYDGSTRPERQEILESTETFVDAQHGYIGSQIGTLGERCQVALFKRPQGGYLLAYNEDGDPASQVPTKLFLLTYEEGRWADVTAQLLPVPVNKLYHYDLPQIGTTIKVTTSKGKKMYDLAWKDGKFEKQ